LVGRNTTNVILFGFYLHEQTTYIKWRRFIM